MLTTITPCLSRQEIDLLGYALHRSGLVKIDESNQETADSLIERGYAVCWQSILGDAGIHLTSDGMKIARTLELEANTGRRQEGK